MKRKILLLTLIAVITITDSSPAFAVLADEQSRIGNGIFHYNPNDQLVEKPQSPCTSSGVSGGDNLANVPDPWRTLIVSTAGKYPTVDMRLVAATLWIENRGWPDYEKDWATSSAGAQGPWQFIPSTWKSMGTDGDGDGKKDPNNPKDAVHAAFKHQLDSAGKPIIVGYTGDIEAGLSLIFHRKTDNLLYFLAKYNGRGAPDGVALKDFPRGDQNSDYVMYGYYLLTSNFTKKWNGGNGSENIAGAGNTGTGGAAASCASSEVGFVNTDGFSFPLGLEKKKITYLPCNKTTCHHDGTPASDMFAPVGTSVFAIEDGTVETVKGGYKDEKEIPHPECYSINFAGKSGWKYWYGHIQKPTVSGNQKVKAGTKLAVVGETKCAKHTPTHLHIDRGDPKGFGGGYDDHRSGTIIPLLNSLFEELPG